jgi:hypothetical protein
MKASRRLAGLLGPVLIVLGLTEILNNRIWFAAMAQAPASFAPLVYLNGTLLFVAGLAIVRDHNRWRLRWPLLMTLVGWFLVLLGLARMVFPEAPSQDMPNTTALIVLEGVLAAIGAFLTFKAYWKR